MGEGAIEKQWGNQRKKRYFLNKRFPVKTKNFFTGMFQENWK